MQQQNLDLLKRCLLKIFLYHGIEQSEVLKAQWWADLKDFPVYDVEQAWDTWRKDSHFEGRKPKSYDLVRLLSHRAKPVYADPHEPLPAEGISFTADSVRTRIDKMHENMPNLIERLRETKSPFQKMAICAAALGDENVMKNEFVKYLCRKAENAI